MNKKKVLGIIFSVASGIVLLLQAFGVNSGEPVLDGIISGISGLLMAVGVVECVPKKDDEDK